MVEVDVAAHADGRRVRASIDVNQRWKDVELKQDELERQAERYFGRPGYSSPAYIDVGTTAILDDQSGVPQLSMLDPTTMEVTPVTSFSERVLSLLTSRSGTIVFGMDTGGNERQQLWAIDAPGSVPRQLTSAPEAIHEPGAISRDGAFVLARTNARDEATFDIVRLDIATGDSATLWEAAGNATTTAISDDASRALVIRTNTNLDADVWLVDTRTGERTNLTVHDGEAWMLGAAFGPDGDSVWILTNRDREFVRLEQLAVSTGERTVIAERDWDIEAFRLSPDACHLALSVNENGASTVSIVALEPGGAEVVIEGLGLGTVDRFSWAPDSSHVAFGFSTAEAPSRIVTASPDGSFRATPEENDAPTTSPPELVRYTSFDGLEISGFLFRPTGDGPFPVLIEVHGGPESQRRLQYASAVPTNQFICSLGIAVFALNVRGSTGYGKRYSHLDDIDLRLDSVRDVAEAVAWLRSRDDVVPDRIGVMGQSYGGFMTLASIAFHPELWTVAVDVVGIANFVSFLERTGPWRREHRSQEYGFLDRDRDLLERISPLNHVDAITTPLYVIHGRNDPRVPLYEAEQIVDALQQRGQRVELRVFDDEGHGLSKRRNRVAGYASAAGFLVEHLLR